jgi:hypothetical protein
MNSEQMLGLGLLEGDDVAYYDDGRHHGVKPLLLDTIQRILRQYMPIATRVHNLRRDNNLAKLYRAFETSANRSGKDPAEVDLQDTAVFPRTLISSAFSEQRSIR